jgi:hypothetical protein
MEQAIVFDDDITVSSGWYKWPLGGARNNRNRTDMAGISLQGQALNSASSIQTSIMFASIAGFVQVVVRIHQHLFSFEML